MNRRTAIRNAALISAGATLMISCQDKASVVLKNIPLTGSDEFLLEQLTAAIIPKTDFVGAADLNARAFVLMMADDCMSPGEQKKFSEGMVQFDEACRKKFGSRFAKCTTEQKNEFLSGLEQKGEETDSVTMFYRTVKRFTVQQFTTSREYMVQVKKYNMIPGDFRGCVAVSAAV